MPETAVVLLVEDQTAYASDFADACEDVTVRGVDTAAEARDRIEDEPVDCVVANYELPDDDGVSLLESVRETHPDLPFVLLTAAGSERVASEAVAANVTDYLPASTVDDPNVLRDRIMAAVESQPPEDDRIQALTTAFPDVAFLLDEDGYYRELLVGPNTAALTVDDPAELAGTNLHDQFPDGMADRFLDHIHATLASGGVETMEYPVELDDGEHWFEARTTPLGRAVEGKEMVVWVARDVTDRRERERRLERQHDELETLNQINKVIQDVVHGLVQAATREEIEQMVCDRLVASGLYELAWTDENEMNRQGLSPRARAGEIDGYLDKLVDLGNAIGGDPATRSMETGEIQVVQNVAESTLLTGAFREEALDRDIESGISIPLSYGNTVYGSLSLVSTRAGVFSERAQSAFEILGGTIGFAINAAKNRKLLLSDTAVELELRVTDSGGVLLDIAERLNCTCHLQGLVPAPEGHLLHYVRVADASSRRVTEAMTDADPVEECRLISDEDDGDCVLEVVMSASTVKRLVEAGAVVQSATATSGEVRLLAEVPQEADVRAIVDTFQSAYAESELVGKRTVDRPIQTAHEFRQSLTDPLTDRQEMVLRTAYFAGYYDWPRGSTAEEIAESLDIASATLHYHLRKAQDELLGAVFD
ncbi:bacterio-opsin activator domain-containing protein [Halomicrococcus sp. NG-SE-24]|uniref:bacterio-opsin activator domain-containing protein n=1 Tax=Halomicrococcus sp. NG-SE-24 TaxID=3436928 RepID=UPI003D96FFFF